MWFLVFFRYFHWRRQSFTFLLLTDVSFGIYAKLLLLSLRVEFILPELCILTKLVNVKQNVNK